MKALLLGAALFAAFVQAGCGGGEVVLPCVADDCNASCVAAGNRAGECRTGDMCVCIPNLDIPPGPTQGLSSGGTVVRTSSNYQLELTVGSVSPAAEGMAGAQRVELGIPPQTDPERTSR